MRSRKKENNVVEQIIVEKIRKDKIQALANSYQEFARTLLEFPVAEIQGSRSSRIENQSKIENRNILSKQMNSFADCFAKTANEHCQIRRLHDKYMKRAILGCKAYGISIKQGFFYKDEDGSSYFMEMKIQRKQNITMNEICGLLSVAFERDMICVSRDTIPSDGEYHIYQFEEKPLLHIMSGFAKAIRQGETISGDNISLVEKNDQSVYLIMVDGTGSGKKANEESNIALDLVEIMLQGSNSLEQAMILTGSAFGMSETDMHYPSMDACCIHLDSYICEFVKAGAVASFVKHEKDVTVISGGGTPLGAFLGNEMKRDIFRLESNSYIVMVSDGVLENMECDDPETVMASFCKMITLTNPKEIANQVLQFAILQSGGKVKDDMLVYVAGAWENVI